MTQFDVQQCDHCGTRVLPKSDGSCPACQKLIGTSHPRVIGPAPERIESDESHIGTQRSAAARSAPITRILIATAVLVVVGIVATVYISKQKADVERRLLIVEIKRFGLLYHEFYSAYRRAPTDLVELESFTPPNPFAKPGFYHGKRVTDAIRQGRFVVVWSAVFTGDSDENEKYLLGYENTAPEKGGVVLHANGVVREITADEFKSFPKVASRVDSSQ